MGLFERKENVNIHDSFEKERLINKEDKKKNSKATNQVSISLDEFNHSMTRLVDEKERNSSIKSEDLLNSRNLARKSQPSKLLIPNSNDVMETSKHIPETPIKFNNENFGYSSFAKPQNNKQYTIINELSKSDYFGEISIMTKLPATATIHVVANTI